MDEKKNDIGDVRSAESLSDKAAPPLSIAWASSLCPSSIRFAATR